MPGKFGRKKRQAVAATDVVVSADSPKAGRKLPSFRRLRSKKFIVLILVLAAAGGAYWYTSRPKPNEISPGPKCSPQILRKARGSLDPTRLGYLEPTVREIEAIPGYDQDPNCLAVVLTYYMNSTNLQKSEEVFTKLEQTYDADTGYNAALGGDVKPPQELKKMLEAMRKQIPSGFSETGAPR